jgi:cobalt-zinc-cadmium resistance protein CzcA
VEQKVDARDDRPSMGRAMGHALDGIPGMSTNFSQPIKDNLDEALAGVKGELAIKVFGPDLLVLEQKAREIAAILRGIRGVSDLDHDHLIGQPQLRITVDRAATACFGISVQDVQDAVEAASKGRTVTTVFEGERRNDLAVRVRKDGEPLEALHKVAARFARIARGPGQERTWPND